MYWPELGLSGFQQGGSLNNQDPLTANSAVYACINVLSSDISKLPIGIFKHNENGGVDPQPRHALARIFRHPNHYQTWMDLIQLFIISLLWRGNAYILVVFNQKNEPEKFYVLHPDRCRPHVDETTGEIHYQVTQDALNGLSEGMMVPARFIIHHRNMTFNHPLEGISPLHAAGLSAGTGLAMMHNSASFFHNQSRPSGVLQTDNVLDDDVIKRLKDQWTSLYAGRNVGKTAILEQGVKWEPLTMTAMDAQLIDQLRFTVQDVARAFRVPNFMLGELEQVNYNNSETLNRYYLSSTLGYHLESIENRINSFFNLTEKGLFVQFDVERLLRADFKQRMDGYRTGIQGGIYAPNEARVKEGLGKVEGGDQVYMQQQMIPLDKLKDGPADSTPEPTAEDVKSAVARKLEAVK